MEKKSCSVDSIANNSPTFGRNVESILNGTRAFVWSRELMRTDQPYIDHKYHIPYNPPPNEVNFVGGLGPNCGHRRSKVHPNRPTIVQQIYRMRNHNCIDVNFTQPLTETNNCVRSTKKKSSERKSVKEIVQEISLADIGETNSMDSIQSDISENVCLARKVREKIARNSEDATEAFAIDGIPFNVRRRQIRMQVDEIVRKFAEQSSVATDNGVLPNAHGTFREWMSETHRSQDCPAPKITNVANTEQERTSETSSPRSSVGRAVVRKKKYGSRRRRCRPNALNRLAGYMNGPFSREKPNTFSSDRFDIPFSMIDRAKKEHEKRDIQANVLRRVRLSHMGYRQPPSKDDSSDNESIQNVKRLALLRTPYFLVPTIKISQVRKKERIRNKFLRKDRLNRINLLLFDRSKKSMEPVDGVGDGSGGDDGSPTTDDETVKVTKKHQYFAKFFQLGPKKKIAPQRDPMKAKYCKIIYDKFEEHRVRCDPNDQREQRLTFDEFKRRQHDIEDDPIKANDSTPTAGIEVVTTQQNRDQTIDVAEKLFAAACRSKRKLHRTEPIDGPLYIDPHLNEKVKNPRKFNTRNKYYTNLFKSKFGLRKRVHVNGEQFEHGKLGVARDENFPRLPTEWDDYYVHEMRYRRPTAKFCVKTDILKLREMVRKNFLMYYAQENLFDLKARQMAENRLMDEVEFFATECDKLFDGWCDEAYSKVFAKNEALDAIQTSNAKLALVKTELFDKCDKLSKEILLNENRWDFLLKIQNYYYLLMEASWREENDWIHRDSSGQLLQPLVAIHTCPHRYIRTKSECSAEAVRLHFEREIEPKLEQMKSVKPDAKLMTNNLNILLRKSFVSLEQHNKTIWTYKTIQKIYEQMRHDMTEFENLQREKINVFERRLRFASDRCRLLEAYNQKTQADLAVAIKNPIKRTVMRITEALYERFAPIDRREAALIDNTTQMDKFKFIHRHCMALLQNLDEIPIDVLTDCEKSVRERRRLDKERAKEAIVAQKRLDMFAKQLKQRFMPAAVFRRVQIPTIIQKRIRAARKVVTPKMTAD